MARADLILASGSPRRAELLQRAGLALHVAPVDCDETIRPREAAHAYVQRIAAAKLEAALAATDDSPDVMQLPVLVADTVVADGDDPLGKATSRDEAAAYLRRLTRGTAHTVSTAWAVAFPGGAVQRDVETTRVHMRGLGERELQAYLDTQEWRDKAGAYAIQGRAAAFVDTIEGSYTNVVGLPLSQVLTALRRGPASSAPPSAVGDLDPQARR